MKISTKINILSVIRWLILSTALIAVIIPLIYLVINSLKLPKEFLNWEPKIGLKDGLITTINWFKKNL